jgi:hypothetical protein
MSIIATWQDEGLQPENKSEKPYEWVTLPGNLVRPKCREHGKVMKWAMKMSKDYPSTVNKHTRTHHAHPVVYMGLPIQIYRCPHEGCETEAVK